MSPEDVRTKVNRWQSSRGISSFNPTNHKGFSETQFNCFGSVIGSTLFVVFQSF